jgi:hypothetical protein
MTALITEWAEQIAGIQTKSKWEWCFRFYSSFADCPIGAANKTIGNVFVVAVINPSLIGVNRTKIAVPSANYSVSVYNQSTRTFTPVEAAVLCDYHAKTGIEDNCWLHAKHRLEGNSLGFMLVTKNYSANIDALRYDHNASGNTFIENDLESLQYKSFDQEHGA